MRNKLMILAVAAVAGVISVPFAAHADDATSLTNQAVVELTDPPESVGGRPSIQTNVGVPTLGRSQKPRLCCKKPEANRPGMPARTAS